ncbi:MAG: hypothetical protein ACRDMV_24845 [Streptosporangiales bacterium]
MSIQITITGNLTDAADASFTAFSRGFVISEVVAGWNRRVAVQW